jgi:hypothetical protein
MARAPKSKAARSGGVLVDQSNMDCEFGLGLESAELEALIERLYSCSTLRVKRRACTQSRARCPHRLRKGWCRMGERATDSGLVETRFG